MTLYDKFTTQFIVWLVNGLLPAARVLQEIADIAPHMEGCHADIAPHIERRHSFRDQIIAKTAKISNFPRELFKTTFETTNVLM